jgi:CDP-6-deoxy-D-xylo-4-hexulose-3-dehydrase
MKVPLASSGLRPIDIEAATRVLNSGQLTMGAEVKKFESKMASYLRVKHFVMVNSGSSANLLMIESLLRPTIAKPKLSQGDCILVPAIAWPTTIWPLIQLGLNPIFVDIDPETLALDLTAAQTLIDSSRIPVSGIFPIHPLGHAISPEKLEEFARKNDLVVVNDVCESLGSWRENRHAGIVGQAASFSFYFSHHITTMEGGGIATNDDLMADDLRSMRSHGWSRDRLDSAEWGTGVTKNDSKFLFVSTGYNVRPMEIQAAIGSLQIDDIDKFVARRRLIATEVSKAIQGTELSLIGVETLSDESLRRSNSWMLLPLQVTAANYRERKIKIVEELENAGIETRPVLTGNFLSQPAIQRITRNSVDPEQFSSANFIANSSFLVGAHHDLSDEQIAFLCKTLRTVSIT